MRRAEFSWTAERDAELKSLLKQGCTFTEIGAIFGISRNAVSGRKFRLGICNPTRARPYTDNDVATITALRRSGATWGQIAKKLRRSEASVFKKINAPYVPLGRFA